MQVQHEYYHAVFSMAFETFVLVAYSPAHADINYWRTGVSPADLRAEQQQFHDAALHLATTYAGKTFVLQHWEGDWSLRGSYNASQPLSPVAVAAMIDWLAARQAGVASARAKCSELKSCASQILAAAEVNLVRSSYEHGWANMVTAVVPRVSLDLISYSSYDAMQLPEFGDVLAYIARMHNRTSASPLVAVYIGEYGLPQQSVCACVCVCVWGGVHACVRACVRAR